MFNVLYFEGFVLKDDKIKIDFKISLKEKQDKLFFHKITPLTI